jgi:exopolysaccharide production protein ExoQ
MHLKINNRDLEYTYYIFGLLLLTYFFAAFEGRQGIRADMEQQASILSQIGAIIILGGLIILVNKCFKRYTSVLKSNLLIIIIAGLAVLSFFWSVQPVHTLLRAFALVIVTAFGVLIAVRLKTDEILRLLYLVALIAAIVGLVYFMLFPDLGVHRDHHYGSFRGTFGHRNQFGRVMALGIASIISLKLYGEYISKKMKISFMIFCGLLLLSQSATSILLGALIGLTYVGLIFLKKFRTKKYVLYVYPSILLVILSGILISNFENILTALDRSPTLTGRVPFWFNALTLLFNHNIWLGFGYDAFFNDPTIASLFLGWMPSSAHNGFIQLVLDLGLIGLAAMILIFIRIFVNITQYSVLNKKHLWGFIILVYVLITNIPEAHLLNHARIYWIILVITLIKYNSRVN